MTSGRFTIIPVDSITVDREGRQRRDLGKIEDLAASISARGLIHPLVVTEDHHLVAGERRLTAIRSLGWDRVSVQYVDDLPEDELELIELEENTKRLDIPWQDQVKSLQRLHSIYKAQEPSWTPRQTAERTGFSYSFVTQVLFVGKAL